MSARAACFHQEDSTPVRVRLGPFSRFLTSILPQIALAILPVLAPVRAQGDAPLPIGFDSSEYHVAPGASFSVSVVLPALPNGLFSYGVRLALPVPDVSATGSQSIVVPTPLDFNGTAGPGALQQITGNFLGVKGTVDFNAVNAAYKGALLTTFNLKNEAGIGQSYTLTLDVFRTLGESETVFVDGVGNNLDPRIVFGSATVLVVPEPSLTALICLACALVVVTRRRPAAAR